MQLCVQRWLTGGHGCAGCRLEGFLKALRLSLGGEDGEWGAEWGTAPPKAQALDHPTLCQLHEAQCNWRQGCVCVRVVMGGCGGRLENGAGTPSWRVSLPGLQRSVDVFLESGAI